MNTLRPAGLSLSLLPLLLALLAGCGPTTGGTGTGEGSLASFGATAASTCSAPFANALSCASISLTPTAPGQLAGTATVVFVGESASGPWVLTLSNNQAVLQSRCGNQRFEGEWGVQGDGVGRFYGHWVAPAPGMPPLAQLWLQALPGRDEGLIAQVQDASGRAQFGPLTLRQVPTAPTAPPVCP